MKKQSILFVLFAAIPLSSEGKVVCRWKGDLPAATYCRGVASDEQIYLKEEGPRKAQERLRLIPSEIASLDKRLWALKLEKEEKSEAYGKLSGRLTEIYRASQLLSKTLKGLETIREHSGRIRDLPEHAIPELLRNLRRFLTEREELLNFHIAVLMESAEKSVGRERESIQLSLDALLELKVLRELHPGKASELLRNLGSPEARMVKTSPITRALLHAAWDAEVINGQTHASFRLLEDQVNKLMQSLKLDLEASREASMRLEQEVNLARTALEEVKARESAAIQQRSSLNAEMVQWQNFLANIPVRIQELDEMWRTGCYAKHKVVEVCEDDGAPEREPKICRQCRGIL